MNETPSKKNNYLIFIVGGGLCAAPQRVDKPFGTEGLKAPSDEGAVAAGD